MHHPFSALMGAFFLGVLLSLVRTNLTIPASASRAMALYLLWVIGFKGGVELAHTAWTPEALRATGIGLGMSIIIPLFVFLGIKNRFSLANAGAIAASYGSVSMVTFITAVSYLENAGIPYGGYMVGLMALMEFPAIVVSLMLIQRYDPTLGKYSYPTLLKEVFTSGSVILLLGSLCMGYFTHPAGVQALKPFVVDLQKGILIFFLLDMGLLAGKNIIKIKEVGYAILLVGILIPIINATIGIFLTHWLSIGLGNSLLLTMLLASASYIAIPAAFRVAMPAADASLYVLPAVAITLPFNVMIGLPLYSYILKQWAL
jgi:hypothetical protein